MPSAKSDPIDNDKKLRRLESLRVLMVTKPEWEQHHAWPAEVYRLEVQLGESGHRTPPDLLQKWQDRCAVLEKGLAGKTKKKKKSKKLKRRMAELEVLRRLIEAPWLRQHALPVPPRHDYLGGLE